MRITFIAVLSAFAFLACFGSQVPSSPDANDEAGSGIGPEKPIEKVDYQSLYDLSSNKGQYYVPEMKAEISAFWNCSGALDGPQHNSPTQSALTKGLQYNLLCQSLAGIVNRAYEEGRSEVYMWLGVNDTPYENVRKTLGKEIGRASAIDILSKQYSEVDGINVNVRDLVKGYVLTDVVGNPESAQAAATASHVFDAIIVDVRDKDYFDQLGLPMKYDARKKTTVDAWKEFKDKCSDRALVIMPVHTGELREFAIKNKLFTININKVYGDPSQGQNQKLFDEVLAWLAPNTPVFGWEGGVGEADFVSKVSSTGHLMQPADWSYNTSLTSINYKSRQKQILSKVMDPRTIDYDQKGNFVSFFITDGDNYQMMMKDGFMRQFIGKPSAERYNVSYGMCCASLSQLAPDRFAEYMQLQRPESTVMETFGCGYFYADTYSEKGNRAKNIKILAEQVADHMRQHRLKVLHLMTLREFDSPAAKAAYKAFIDANDQLEGVVVIQYAPYNGGYGQVLWSKNKAGYDIPIVTTKYSIWDLPNSKWQSEPVKLAASMDEEAKDLSHAFVAIHCWSKFGPDEKSGPDAAEMCMEAVKSDYRAVNAQELIWRIRMKERPEQTERFFSTLK